MKAIRPEHIVAIVADFYKLDPAALTERTRRREIIKARQVCWLFMRRFIDDMTVIQMGRHFGYDHTTVIRGLESLAAKLERYYSFHREIEEIAQKIKAV